MARHKNEDPKEAALRKARALNPRPEGVIDDAFAESEFLDARDLVQVKYEMVRRVHFEGEAVSAAASAFGFSRPSWYAASDALETAGLPGLLPARPGPRRGHKLTEEIVDFVEQVLDEDGSLRPADLVSAVTERFGVSVHPRSIERALTRRRAPKSGR